MRLAVSVIIGLLPGVLSAQDVSTAYTRADQQRALEIYRATISYRSAASHGQVPALAEYLADELRRGGIPSEDVHVLPLTLPTGEVSASLVARYRGSGRSGERPILLLAHMDVVDALPQDWERDPFTLIEDGGYFFGRGTVDDKYGVVMLVSAFIRLKQEGFTPGRDIILAFTGDEETGMLTTRDLMTTHRSLVDAEFALNADQGGGILSAAGEPIFYTVQTAEKTSATFELTVTNPGGHSASPRPDNAIYELADVLRRIGEHQFPVDVNPAVRLFFEVASPTTPGELGRAMERLAANPADRAAADTVSGNPDYVGQIRTTCVATMLRAGHAVNALPQTATATVNCRILPGIEVSAIADSLRRIANHPTILIEAIGDPRASPASPIHEGVMAAVAGGVERIRPGTPVVPYMSASGSDGREVRSAGIPTYGVFGMFMKESDIFVHGLNERIPVYGFFEGLEYWPVILRILAG